MSDEKKSAFQKRQEANAIKAGERKAKKMLAFLASLDKPLRGLSAQFSKLEEDFPCLQYQLIGQDLISIRAHIDDLLFKGPRRPHKYVPLEESEIPLQESDLPAELRNQKLEIVSGDSSAN